MNFFLRLHLLYILFKNLLILFMSKRDPMVGAPE